MKSILKPFVRYLYEIVDNGSDFEMPSSSSSYLKKLSTISMKNIDSLKIIIHMP